MVSAVTIFSGHASVTIMLHGVVRMSRYDIRIASVFLNGTTLCLAVHTAYLSVSASIKQFVMEVVGYFVQAY